MDFRAGVKLKTRFAVAAASAWLLLAFAKPALTDNADLPAALVPGGNRPCEVGQQVTMSGTIQDVKREKQSWSAGTIAHVDHCSGLTDPSTGFAALFGKGGLPPACRGGKRFFATGQADYGREPEFFLKVHKIACD
jgi:hypothetical protein